MLVIGIFAMLALSSFAPEAGAVAEQVGGEEDGGIEKEGEQGSGGTAEEPEGAGRY
jgi:hypothetical protein